MKRIVKHPDIRRAEILAAAEKLFAKQGYSKTSVEAIIQDAGIAKGTFYYYFKSKTDILQALVEQTGSQLEEYFKQIAENKQFTALQKLEKMLRGPEKQAKANSSVMKTIHKSEHRELQEGLNIQCINTVSPILFEVLQQGYQEGVFSKLVSLESIQLMLAGSQFILDSGLFQWGKEQRLSFLKSIQDMFELMTGAKSGLLKFISEE